MQRRRYHYKQAFIRVPLIRRDIQVVKISDGIDLLEVIGNGKLVLHVPTLRAGTFLYGPKPSLDIKELIGKSPEDIMTLFDRETDIEIALQATASARASLHFNAWPERPEIGDDLDKKRLTHFARLMLCDIRIIQYPDNVSKFQSASLDACLTQAESYICGKYDGRHIYELLNLAEKY